MTCRPAAMHERRRPRADPPTLQQHLGLKRYSVGYRAGHMEKRNRNSNDEGQRRVARSAQRQTDRGCARCGGAAPSAVRESNGFPSSGRRCCGECTVHSFAVVSVLVQSLSSAVHSGRPSPPPPPALSRARAGSSLRIALERLIAVSRRRHRCHHHVGHMGPRRRHRSRLDRPLVKQRLERIAAALGA